VAGASFPACYVAEQHGEGRRDFYFVTEDAAGFERIARSTAEASGFDGAGFRAVLKEIAPLAHSLRCRYRGTETIGGLDQFSLLHPLPERYAAERRLAPDSCAARTLAIDLCQTLEQLKI
jgi:hypothetical protein